MTLSAAEDDRRHSTERKRIQINGDIFGGGCIVLIAYKFGVVGIWQSEMNEAIIIVESCVCESRRIRSKKISVFFILKAKLDLS